MYRYLFFYIIIGLPHLVRGQHLSKYETDTSIVSVYFDDHSATYFETNALKDSPVCYCKELYIDSTTLKRKGNRYYDANVGKWDYFTSIGEKYMTIDYATIDRQLFDTIFVYEDYWQGIRQKADSIVLSYYSPEFFDAHIKLDANNTIWNTKTNEGLWFEMFESKPISFEMAYLIMFSQKQGFHFVEFELDSDGNLVKTFRNKGLHKINKCCFGIDDKKINQIIKDTKLEEDPGSEWALEWNEEKQDLEIRISNSRLIEYGGKMVLKSRTIYVDPWNGEYSDVQEEINEVIM